MIIWCTASTKMMKLNWSTVTIFNNHDCSFSMHNEGTWITWQHIHFLSYCNFLAIFKWWPVDNFSFRKTDFNFSWQYFISALIRYYLFSTKQTKTKIRLQVFMHLYGLTINPLWSCFEKGQLGVFIYPYGSLYTREQLSNKRDIVMQKNWWREGLGRAGGYRKLWCLFFLNPNLHSQPQPKVEIMSEYLLHFMLLITNHTIGRKRETEFSFLHWQNKHIQGSRRRE